jgi:predicted AAA+ superfamily ATPase
MEELFDFFYKELRKTDLSFQRYLINDIDWDERLSAITGARGTGKTTLILQHIKQTFGNSPKEALYVSADNIWFSGNRLFDLANDFEKQGGKYLFIDEVHKYENWSQEIKNIYDSFSNLKVVVTGSSMLQIYKGNADLSRRAVHYDLRGLSFREF